MSNKLLKEHEGLYEFDESRLDEKNIGFVRAVDGAYRVGTLEGKVETYTVEQLLEEGLLKPIAKEPEPIPEPAPEPASAAAPSVEEILTSKEEPAPAPEPADLLVEEPKEEPAPEQPSLESVLAHADEASAKEPEPAPAPEPAPEPEPEIKVEPKYDPWTPGFDFVLEKENEDAIPFRDPELCVVCDGMGGTGSKKITIDDKAKFAKAAWSFMEDIYKEGDGNLIDFAANIEQDLFKDTESLTASNATFASRIICARFAYIKRHRFPDLTPLLVFEEKEEKEGVKKQIITTCKEGIPSDYLPSLAEMKSYSEDYLKKAMVFVTFGLVKVAKDFGIAHYAESMLAVLPATLCATFTHEVDGKRVTDVFWAGDSRAYAIVKGKGKGKGMQLIMQDDERGDGKMNNFICAERLAEMHYVRIDDLPTDAMIFACSDGAFDPFPYYDSTAIDAIFSQIMKEYADKEFLDKAAWDEFAQKLSDTYLANYRADDISFALTVYGNKKAFLGKDFEIIDEESIQVFTECRERHPTLQTLEQLAMGNPLEDHYLEERSKLIVQSRPQVIAQLYFSEEPDIAMPDELRGILNEQTQPRPNIDGINEACYQFIVVKHNEGFAALKPYLTGALLPALENEEKAFEEAKELFAKQGEGIVIEKPEQLRESLDSVLRKDYLDKEEAVRKYEQAKAQFNSMLERVRRESIIECLQPEEVQRISAEVPPQELTQPEKEAVVLDYIKTHPDEVARYVGESLTKNYDKESALDKFCLPVPLANARRTLSVLANPEEGIKFFNQLKAREEESLFYIKKHFNV